MAGNYVFENEKLLALEDQVSRLVSTWNQVRNSAEIAVNGLINSDGAWKGNSADRVRDYMQITHLTAIQTIDALVTQLYSSVQDYHGNGYAQIDNDAHCIIDTGELDALKNKTDLVIKALGAIGNEITAICNGVSDISDASFGGFGAQLSAVNQIIDQSNRLQEAIEGVEGGYAGNVSELNEMADSVGTFLAGARGYDLFSFNAAAYRQNQGKTIDRLVMAYQNSCRSIQASQANQKIIEANLTAQYNQLQREYQVRQIEANFMKIGAGVLLLIGSIALAPATGGASMLALGFITGAVGGGVNEIVDQWTIYGGYNDYSLIGSTDWGEVGVSMLKGGVSGTATSAFAMLPFLGGATTWTGKVGQAWGKKALGTVFDEGYGVLEATVFGKKEYSSFVDGKVVTTYDEDNHYTKYWAEGHFNDDGNWIEGHTDIGRVYEAALNATVINGLDSIVSTTIDMGFDDMLFEDYGDGIRRDWANRKNDTAKMVSIKTAAETTGSLITSGAKDWTSAYFDNLDKYKNGEITKEERDALMEKDLQNSRDERPENILWTFLGKLAGNTYETNAKMKAMSDGLYVANEESIRDTQKGIKEVKNRMNAIEWAADETNLDLSKDELYQKEKATLKALEDKETDGIKYKKAIEKEEGAGATKGYKAKFKYEVVDDEKYKYEEKKGKHFDPSALDSFLKE